MMGRNTNHYKLIKRLQIGLTALTATAGVTLGAGCSNANTESTKQSVPYTESIENLDQQLEEANRKILVDYSLFSNHESFSKLTMQGKANATVQVDKDMDEWMRIQIAKAVTESTHQACSPEDVWTFCSDGVPGFTWEDAENTYTIRDRIRAEKTISSSTICNILKYMADAKRTKYLVNTNGKLVMTDYIDQRQADMMVENNYKIALKYINKFIENGNKIVFDKNNFSINKNAELSYEGKQLNLDEDVEELIKSLNVEYKEEEQSLEQLDRQLEEYANIFRTREVYTAMSTRDKNELYRNVERDMYKYVCIQLADAITKGTGKQCSPEDVVIFSTSDRHIRGITWTGAEKAIIIEKRGDENPQLAPEIKKIIIGLINFSNRTRYDNGDGMTSTCWIDLNTDIYEHEKEYGEDSARFVDIVLFMNFCKISFDGNNFEAKLDSKQNDTEVEANKATNQDSADWTH